MSYAPILLEPTSATDVARMLREATERRQAVVVRGNGTKARWGLPALRTDAILSLARLADPIEHCAGDLTVTAPAGATLESVNALLAREGQWLPLDPWAGGRSTIGGLLATNDSGPRRLRSGAPRDLVIGIDYALTDGRQAKAGGRVVKNVAGYDMGRLLCGSFGSLAVMTRATFKLSPIPPASRTVVIDVPSPEAYTRLAQELAASPVTPSAVEVQAPVVRLLVRFETTATAAEEQAAAVLSLAARHDAAATLLDAAGESAVWIDHGTRPGGDTATLLRVSALPTQVGPLLGLLDAQTAGVSWRLAGRALLGIILVTLDGDASAVSRVIAAVRQLTTATAGHVAVLMAPSEVTARNAIWDEVGGAAVVMRAVKAQFDPHGILCPGGGPGGLA